MGMTVKVSPKFQVVIPQAVRARLGIRAGSEVEVIAKGGIAYLVPLKTAEERKQDHSRSVDQLKLFEKNQQN